MANRSPIVQASGELQQLQNGELLSGTIFPNLQVLTAGTSIPDNSSIIFRDSLTLNNNVSFTVPSSSQAIIEAKGRDQLIQSANGGASSFDVSTLVPVPLCSKAMTIAAGDQVQIEAMISIANNSGSNSATYNFQFSLGTFVSTLASAAGVTASASSECSARVTATIGVGATNRAWILAWSLGGSTTTVGNTVALGTTFDNIMYNTTSNNLTGYQVATLKVVPSISTATQTLHLVSYTIKQIPAISV